MKRMQKYQLFASAVAILLVATLVRGSTLDITTSGDWLTAGPGNTQKYGTVGSILCDYYGPRDSASHFYYSGYPGGQDLANLPSYISSSYSYEQIAGHGTAVFTWAAGGSSDPRALEDPNQPDPKNDPRINSGVYSFYESIRLTLSVTQAARFQLGLYGICNANNDNVQISVTSSGGTDTADWPQADLFNGEWAIFNVTAAPGSQVVVDFMGDNASSYFDVLGITFDTIVPEPSIAMLLGIGGGLLWFRRRGQRRAA